MDVFKKNSTWNLKLYCVFFYFFSIITFLDCTLHLAYQCLTGHLCNINSVSHLTFCLQCLFFSDFLLTKWFKLKTKCPCHWTKLQSFILFYFILVEQLMVCTVYPNVPLVLGITSKVKIRNWHYMPHSCYFVL